MGSWVRAALIAALALMGANALVDDGAFPYGAGARGDVTAAGGADYFSGRLENSPGYGTYVCYSKRLWGGQKPPADASSLRRFALAANDSVPAAGRVATIGEVAAWAADRLGIPAEQLVAEELSGAVAANDWVDDKGIRHVRLVQWSVDDDASVELGAIVVHLHGDQPILVTGGIIPDLDAKTAKKNVTVADAGAAPLTEAKAAAIALNAALKTIPDAPPALARRMRAAAAHPTPSNLVAASAAPKTRRVVHCSNDGTCSAAYKQVIFLPPTPTTKPQELHVYVAADGGDVLLVADRLHTSRPGAALVAAAAAPPAPQKKDGGADKQKKDDPKKKAPERKPPGVHDDADAQQVWMSLGRGQSLYSGEVPLNTAQGPTAAGGGPYQMTDLVHNAATYDMRNKEDLSDQGITVETLFKDRDNQWGDGTPKDRSSAAVDAHYGASVTLTYYKDVHGRNGVDGRGGQVKSRVHLSKAYDNAYWYDGRMTYGDGSRPATATTTSCKGFPPMVTLDITAHEMAHGVTEHTSGLVYQHSYGGINEGLSDIFAQCVLDYAHTEQGYPKAPDFLVGSQLYSPEANCSRPFLRSMMEPTADGYRSSGCWHTKFDKTAEETHNGSDMWCEVDVHWSSGVANRAFYLMAKGFSTPCNNGTKPEAMGIQPACAVFYRATRSYLSRVADYHELRTATVLAARDIHGAGSPQAAAVAAAWDVVGAPTAAYPATTAPKCDAKFAAKPTKC